MIVSKVFQLINQARIHSKMIKNMFIDDYLNRNLFRNEDYLSNQMLLNNYEFSVYSQNGEDGIISEIFKRIGVTNRDFVEIGVQDGNECNSGLLLTNNWTGLWIEANKKDVQKINKQFRYLLDPGLLNVSQNFVKSDNINSILLQNNVANDFDLLSIDIDGNDYWIWKSLENYRPRVVVIEYNAVFKPPQRWVMKYNENHIWDKTNYYNSSLQSLSELGESKGYKLVCCDFTGTNAFFVADECLGENFFKPGDIQLHYQPQRYFLSSFSYYKSRIGECQTN
jgi:hypothetical protein